MGVVVASVHKHSKSEPEAERMRLLSWIPPPVTQRRGAFAVAFENKSQLR
jgi:hypothetical protein